MISIIVPVYNTEKYLDRCIQSILSQTYTDFELLLVDDGSTDSSGVICDRYAEQDSRVRVFHKENGGVSSARNVGLNNAEGEYIIFVDSDDWMEPAMLEKMYSTAVGKDADLVYCDFNFVKHSGVERYFALTTANTKVETINNWGVSKWTVLWNILVKRTIYQNNNVKFPIGIKYCEDFYVAIQLMCYSRKIVHISEALYNYNMLNQSSILHTESRKSMNNDAAKVYDEVLNILNELHFFDVYGKSVSWKFLDGMQYCVLDKNYFENFKKIHPETHRYIMSCPYLNKKVKIMMWSLGHNLDFIVWSFIKLREIFGRR